MSYIMPVSTVAVDTFDSPCCSNQVFHLVSLALSIRSITEVRSLNEVTEGAVQTIVKL